MQKELAIKRVIWKEIQLLQILQLAGTPLTKLRLYRLLMYWTYLRNWFYFLVSNIQNALKIHKIS